MFTILLFCVLFCQNGLATKVEKSRKQMKERKNRAKKIRGVKKVSYLHTMILLTCSSLVQFIVWTYRVTSAYIC
jgi:hypothetical protein